MTLNINDLKAKINALIKTNNRREITGAIENEVLNDIVDSLAGYGAKLIVSEVEPAVQVNTLWYKASVNELYISVEDAWVFIVGGSFAADDQFRWESSPYNQLVLQGRIVGGQGNASVYKPEIVLDSTDSYYNIRFNFPALTKTIDFMTIASLFGTNDILIQSTPNSNTSALAIEAYKASSLILSTFGADGVGLSKPIIFAPDRGEKMRLTSTGRLGLGVSSPTQNLDMVGSINLENTITSTSGVIYKNGTRFIHNFKHPTGGGAVPNGNNLFIGEGAGNFTTGSTATVITQASENIGIGRNTLPSLTTASSVVAIGNSVGQVLTTGSANVLIGVKAGILLTTGGNNTSVGSQSCRKIADASNNTALGYLANTSNGASNTALGALALFSNAVNTMSDSIAIGYQALREVTTGAGNIAIGSGAGRFLSDNTTQVLSMTDGTYIGRNTHPSANANTNETVIGNNAVGNGTNTVTIGASDTTDTYLKGKVHSTSSVQVGNDASVASASNVGSFRYRTSGNNSYVDVCMQTGAATYAWVNIVQQNW